MPVLNLTDATNAYKQIAAELGVSVPSTIEAGLPNAAINTIMDEGLAGLEKVKQQLQSTKQATPITEQVGSVTDYAQEIQSIIQSLYPEQSSLGELIAGEIKSRVTAGEYALPAGLEDYYSRVAREASEDRGFLYSGESGRAETELLTRLGMDQYNTDIANAIQLYSALPNAVETGTNVYGLDLSAMLEQYKTDTSADVSEAQLALQKYLADADNEDEDSIFEDVFGTIFGQTSGDLYTNLLSKLTGSSATKNITTVMGKAD